MHPEIRVIARNYGDVDLFIDCELVAWWYAPAKHIVVWAGDIPEIKRAMAALGRGSGILHRHVSQAQALIILSAYKARLEAHYASEN